MRLFLGGGEASDCRGAMVMGNDWRGAAGT